MPKKSLLATIANSTLGTVFLIVGGWTIGTKVAEMVKAKGIFGSENMGVSDQPYMVRNMTPADYEEAYVESSGSTADILPVSMSDEFVGSYMGKEVLDLQMTTNLYNDSPFAGPMTDVQAYWENPFRSDVQ